MTPELAYHQHMLEINQNCLVAMHCIYDELRKRMPDVSSVLALDTDGYLLKWMQYHDNLPVRGLTRSKFLYCTRHTDAVSRHPILGLTWPIADKEYDAAFSCDFLNLVPTEQLPWLAAELERTTKRGIHFTAGREQELRAALPSSHMVVPFSELPFHTTLTVTGGPCKVNYGCMSDVCPPGWVNICPAPFWDMNQKDAYLAYRLIVVPPGLHYTPCSPNQGTVIRCSYHLDKLDPEMRLATLKMLWDCLTPGGRLRVTIPKCLPDLEGLEGYRDYLLSFLHKSLPISESETKSLLAQAGFTHIETMPFGKSNAEFLEHETRDVLPKSSIYIEATKLVL